MHSFYSLLSWERWICLGIWSVVFIPQLALSIDICTVCEDQCPPDIDNNNCFCEHRTIMHIEKHWDNWYGRYVITKNDVLYARVDCFQLENVLDESRLNPSICPEDPCKFLTVRRSNISIIPMKFFESATFLEEIFLNSSGVQTLEVGAFYGLVKLKTLQLEDNKLKEIKAGTLNTLSHLKILDLHKNEINKIDDAAFLGLESLENLDLSRNLLGAIPNKLFKPLLNLRVLVLSNNYLTTVNFITDKLNKLETLYLNHNNIENIDESLEKTAVSSLFLQNNAISNFNGSWVPRELTVLNLANKNVSFLDSYTLNKLTNLQTLDISKNAISSIPLDIFKSSENLLKLDLSQNEIGQLKTGVFSVPKNIEYLNLSNINLEKIENHVLTPLNNLKILDISNNNLDFLDSECFDHFDYLEKIYLGGNNFSCKTVSSIFRQAKLKNFSLVYDVDYNLENIKGLTCRYFSVEDSERNIINSNTSIVDWNELKRSLNNISENFEKSHDLIKKEIQKKIDNQTESEHKIQHSMLSEFKENLLKYLQNANIDLLKNITERMGSNPSYSSQTQDLHLNYNAENNNDSSMQSSNFSMISTIFEMNKSLKRLNEFQILVVICLFIFFVYKIGLCCLKSRRKTKSFDLGQELPILS